MLKKQNYDRKQKAPEKEEALLQVSSLTSLSLIPAEAKRAIEAFVQQDQDDDGLAVSAPEANAYEFQSNGVIEMLEKLLDKFITEKTTLEKEEMNSRGIQLKCGTILYLRTAVQTCSNRHSHKQSNRQE